MSQSIQGNNVFMTEEDAVLFVKYMEHREKFISLLKSGMFDLSSGRAEVNINNGDIQNVHLYHMTFKRKKI